MGDSTESGVIPAQLKLNPNKNKQIVMGQGLQTKSSEYIARHIFKRYKPPF